MVHCENDGNNNSTSKHRRYYRNSSIRNKSGPKISIIIDFANTSDSNIPRNEFRKKIREF